MLLRVPYAPERVVVSLLIHEVVEQMLAFE